MSFTSIKDLIPKTAQPPLIKEPVGSADFFNIFRQVLSEELGPTAAKNIQPLFLRNGAVCVLSFHRAASDILRLKEKEITVKLNSRLNGASVRGLRLVG